MMVFRDNIHATTGDISRYMLVESWVKWSPFLHADYH